MSYVITNYYALTACCQCAWNKV